MFLISALFELEGVPVKVEAAVSEDFNELSLYNNFYPNCQNRAFRVVDGMVHTHTAVATERSSVPLG